MTTIKGQSGTVRFKYSQSDTPLDAQILNAAGKAMKLRVKTPVNEGEPVTLELAPGFSERGSISYCRKRGDGFDVVVDLQNIHNRKEFRMQGSEPAIMSDVEDASKPTVRATVVDLSESGVGLIVQQPFHPGALVSVSTESFFVLGEIRHCAPTRDGSAYRVGVRTERITPRQEGTTQPKSDSGSPALPVPAFTQLLQSLKSLWN